MRKGLGCEVALAVVSFSVISLSGCVPKVIEEVNDWLHPLDFSETGYISVCYQTQSECDYEESVVLVDGEYFITVPLVGGVDLEPYTYVHSFHALAGEAIRWSITTEGGEAAMAIIAEGKNIEDYFKITNHADYPATSREDLGHANVSWDIPKGIVLFPIGVSLKEYGDWSFSFDLDLSSFVVLSGEVIVGRRSQMKYMWNSDETIESDFYRPLMRFQIIGLD